MPGLIGKKIGMTSVFSAKGKNVPCTVIEAGPCVVTQIKTVETDGYEAVQLGFGERKEKTAGQPITGHCKAANTTPKSEFAEFDTFASDVKLSDVITVDVIDENGWVDVIGTSKGKGFQGVVKRHNFAGVNDATHGQHNRLRAPGSIGAASYPARVFKGMRMAGRTGGDKVTVKNLKVLKIIPEQNLLLVKGSLPGAKGSTVLIEQ